MQNQQQVNYDLLAVFPDESKANGAADKLKKAGFQEEEVHQLAAGTVGSGLYREHGPNTGRGNFFLQTQQSGPRPAVIILFAVLFGIVLGVLGFVSSLFVHALSGSTAALVGAVIGIVIGAIIGVLQRGRVRGAIGQASKPQTTPPSTSKTSLNETRTVVALSFSDPDNIARNSRARAILLNNQGKIDRSIGKQA
jgi:Carbon starvation protein, predicted membrane protein